MNLALFCVCVNLNGVLKWVVYMSPFCFANSSCLDFFSFFEFCQKLFVFMDSSISVSIGSECYVSRVLKSHSNEGVIHHYLGLCAFFYC